MKTFSNHTLMQHHQNKMSNKVQQFFLFVASKKVEHESQYMNTGIMQIFKNACKNAQLSKEKHIRVLDSAGPYLDRQLRDKVNKLKFQRLHLKYTNNRRIPVSIIIHYRRETQKVLMELLKVVDFMVFYCSSVNTDFKGSIEIKLTLSPFLKQAPQDNEPLSALHVNSGYTSRFYETNHSEIVIYRREEVIKVLLHEILHAFDMDSKTMDSEMERPINNYFKVSKPVYINESFTDTYACLINLVLAAMKYSKPLETFNDLLKYETNHICAMAVKVMKLIGISLRVGAKIPSVNGSSYSETTHVISYYLLKALNFLTLDEFVGYLFVNGMTIGKIDKYALLMLKNLKSIKWKYPRQGLLKIMKKEMPLNSMRMTSIDVLLLLPTTKKVYKDNGVLEGINR